MGVNAAAAPVMREGGLPRLPLRGEARRLPAAPPPGLMPAPYPAAIALFPFPKWGVGIPLRIHLPFMEDGHAVEAGQFR